MKKKQVYIYTFGCQMNVHDSEAILGYFMDMCYEEASDPNKADAIVLNTCTIRATADNKAFALLGRLRPLKARNPELLIIVCGCLSQQSKVARRIKHRFPFVDIVIGTMNTNQLPQLIQQAEESSETIIALEPAPGSLSGRIPFQRQSGITAWVSIMYGCNNFCTYCIVPYVRGRERSRRPDDIISEIKDLVMHGYKEVTLLGQNVNSYGKEFAEPYSFTDLIKDINKIDGLQRIRYMTSHPRDFSPEAIRILAAADKVCKNFHLPVQSGSDRILRLMNRGYDSRHYLSLVDEIKRLQPEATISSDIIVGFPGETQDDFQQTLDMVRRVEFDHSFMFVYNPRSGTPAAEMTDQISDEVKKQRIAQLVDLQNCITLEHNQQQVGTIQEILVEGSSKTNDKLLSGRTSGSRVVCFEGDQSLIGQLVKVKIKEARLMHLIGEYLE